MRIIITAMLTFILGICSPGAAGATQGHWIAGGDDLIFLDEEIETDQETLLTQLDLIPDQRAIWCIQGGYSDGYTFDYIEESSLIEDIVEVVFPTLQSPIQVSWIVFIGYFDDTRPLTVDPEAPLALTGGMPRPIDTTIPLLKCCWNEDLPDEQQQACCAALMHPGP